ncbi:MAG: hypothetical protein AAF989_02170 [Planctomycetota bacterium]
MRKSVIVAIVGWFALSSLSEPVSIAHPLTIAQSLPLQEDRRAMTSELPGRSDVTGEDGGDSGRLTQQLEGEFDSKDIAATSAWANELTDQLNVADWLGPLAPVALSPFFGIALLSGLSLHGPDWITDNALLGASGPLQSPTLFWIFVGLTALTSLPRLTKVSKPFAQAVDRLEAYSVVVILLVIKVVASMEASSGAEVAEMSAPVFHLGIFSFTVDTLLALAMVVNVLVINSVKFFFEFLVWLTPVPFLDAVFEVCNKSLCAVLMAIYAYSPAVATVINLALLVVAAVMLRWISRRVRFYRTMILDPILARCWSGFGTPARHELIVFPKAAIGPFPAKSRLRLAANESGDGWCLRDAGWWATERVHELAPESHLHLRRGWVMHTVESAGEHGGPMVQLTTSRRYDQHLPELVKKLAITMKEDEKAAEDLKAEFA